MTYRGAEWNIVEDLAIASMQLGKREEAHSLVQSTMKQFPSSLRASRLKVRLICACDHYGHGWLDV